MIVWLYNIAIIIKYFYIKSESNHKNLYIKMYKDVNLSRINKQITPHHWSDLLKKEKVGTRDISSILGRKILPFLHVG